MPYTFMCLRSCFSLLSAFCVALFVRSIANVCNRCIRCIRRLANVLPTALLPLVARECMDDQPGVMTNLAWEQVGKTILLRKGPNWCK